MLHPRVRLAPLSCLRSSKVALLSNRRVELWMSGEVKEPCGVLGMSPLPVLGLEQESCLCPNLGLLTWIYLDC